MTRSLYSSESLNESNEFREKNVRLFGSKPIQIGWNVYCIEIAQVFSVIHSNGVDIHVIEMLSYIKGLYSVKKYLLYLYIIIKYEKEDGKCSSEMDRSVS